MLPFRDVVLALCLAAGAALVPAHAEEPTSRSVLPTAVRTPVVFAGPAAADRVAARAAETSARERERAASEQGGEDHDALLLTFAALAVIALLLRRRSNDRG